MFALDVMDQPCLRACVHIFGSAGFRGVGCGFRFNNTCEYSCAQVSDAQRGAAGAARLQAIMAMVQTCCYRYEGSINKFLVDDKVLL